MFRFLIVLLLLIGLPSFAEESDDASTTESPNIESYETLMKLSSDGDFQARMDLALGIINGDFRQSELDEGLSLLSSVAEQTDNELAINTLIQIYSGQTGKTKNRGEETYWRLRRLDITNSQNSNLSDHVDLITKEFAQDDTFGPDISLLLFECHKQILKNKLCGHVVSNLAFGLGINARLDEFSDGLKNKQDLLRYEIKILDAIKQNQSLSIDKAYMVAKWVELFDNDINFRKRITKQRLLEYVVDEIADAALITSDADETNFPFTIDEKVIVADDTDTNLVAEFKVLRTQFPELANYSYSPIKNLTDNFTSELQIKFTADQVSGNEGLVDFNVNGGGYKITEVFIQTIFADDTNLFIEISLSGFSKKFEIDVVKLTQVQKILNNPDLNDNEKIAELNGLVESGNLEAMRELGTLMINGSIGVQDIYEGINLLGEAAQAGDLLSKDKIFQYAQSGLQWANVRLGRSFIYGDFTEINMSKGLSFIEKAAKDNNLGAINILISVYGNTTSRFQPVRDIRKEIYWEIVRLPIFHKDVNSPRLQQDFSRLMEKEPVYLFTECFKLINENSPCAQMYKKFIEDISDKSFDPEFYNDPQNINVAELEQQILASDFAKFVRGEEVFLFWILADEFTTISQIDLQQFKRTILNEFFKQIKDNITIKTNLIGTNDKFTLSDQIKIGQNVETEIEISISTISDLSLNSERITDLITNKLDINFRQRGQSPDKFKIQKQNFDSYKFNPVRKKIPPSQESIYGSIEISLDTTRIFENISFERYVYFPKFMGTGFPLGETVYPSLTECSLAIQNGTVFDGSKYFYRNFIYNFRVGEFSWVGEQPFFQCSRVSVLDTNQLYFNNSKLLPN